MHTPLTPEQFKQLLEIPTKPVPQTRRLADMDCELVPDPADARVGDFAYRQNEDAFDLAEYTGDQTGVLIDTSSFYKRCGEPVTLLRHSDRRVSGGYNVYRSTDDAQRLNVQKLGFGNGRKLANQLKIGVPPEPKPAAARQDTGKYDLQIIIVGVVLALIALAWAFR